jgi:hypothetical protein
MNLADFAEIEWYEVYGFGSLLPCYGKLLRLLPRNGNLGIIARGQCLHDG